MKSRILSLIAFLTLAAANAQVNVIVGNGTGSGTYAPVASWYESSATESIYRGNEVNAIGEITHIAYQKKSGASTIQPNVNIYMKTTTSSILSDDYSIGDSGFEAYTLVYSGELPNNSTTGWMEVTLQTPFSYTDTGKNLAILVTGSTCIDSGRPQYAYTTTEGGKMSAGYNDGIIGCGGNNPWLASSTMEPVWERPNIRLGIDGELSSDDFIMGNDFTIYKNNEVITISSTESQINTVQVFDLSGRVIYSQNNIGSNKIVLNNLKASNQMLIVKVTGADNKIANKKIVF